MSDRISSTELLLAASSSWIFIDRPSSNPLHDSQVPQASLLFGFRQFILFAKIRAQVVLPTPRGPQNRYAWASCPRSIAFLRVEVMCF